MNIADFGKVIAVLEDMCDRGIFEKYAIGGAFAATLHDEPIATIDLDIFFIFSKTQNTSIISLSEIYDYASESGFSFDHEFVNIYGWLVQFVESSTNDLWKEAIENAQSIQVGDRAVYVIQPDYLVAMWLLAGRAKDFNKISVFLENDLVNKRNFLDIVERCDLSLKWKKERHRFEGYK
jgi:hypothetical protein